MVYRISFSKKISNNQDYKTIGFYNPNLPKEKEIDNIDGNDNENNNKTDNKTDNDTNSDNMNNNEKNKDNNDNDKGNKNQNQTDIKNEDKSNNGMSGKSVVLIVVSTGIIFVVVGIIIGKILFKKINNRKRANELKDEIYDYTTYENDDNIN